ncbi:MAG: beta-ketoacyl-ACP synthase III [Alphaproteobacteria bacterium]|nr:beta-ketoacyl-ACP synthase III [Alphaproteobacteria bacterium]
MLRARIIGIGACMPARIVHNNDLDPKLETSHEWIASRTGIEQRYIAGADEFTSTLAAGTAKNALQNAGVEAMSIDLILVATTTPDDTMPATATKVQHVIGAKNAAAFDINAACSGFVYAMTTANSFIVSGAAKRVLVIGAETYSRIMDWTDRSTCVLFGDGAAALLLEAAEGQGTADDRGILASQIYTDGAFTHQLNTTGGVSSTQVSGHLTMAGKEIFRHAVGKMPDAVMRAMQSLGLPLSAIDWLVPHQANQRILAGVAQKLEIGDERIISTVAQHANTSAASIPLALYTGVQDGRIKEGQLIACPALGAGLTWGCTVLRW